MYPFSQGNARNGQIAHAADHAQREVVHGVLYRLTLFFCGRAPRCKVGRSIVNVNWGYINCFIPI